MVHYLFVDELAFISDRLQAVFNRCAGDVATISEATLHMG